MFHCKTCVEDEMHVLVVCLLYSELRHKYCDNLQDNGINMHEKSPMTQFTFILGNTDEKLVCHILLRHLKNNGPPADKRDLTTKSENLQMMHILLNSINAEPFLKISIT